MAEQRNIVVLGSTGSIGRQTLEVAALYPQQFKIWGLAGGRNLELLSQQVKNFYPKVVCIQEENDLPQFRALLQAEPSLNYEPQLCYGVQGMKQLAALSEADLVVSAVSGAVGLLPALSALQNGKQLALANKETLVAAGRLIMTAAYRQQIQILPVDSEHSAIFQCLQGQPAKEFSKLWLTASGGPFWTYNTEQLQQVTAEQALKHPKWTMGRKITVDSATLMNKGLEVIEAKWLFAAALPQIKVLIHPQSVIHSMVEFVDGVVLAQLGLPDMRLPIQYALTFPERQADSFPRLDFYHLGQLTFAEPDLNKFPCLRIAFEAAEAGGTYPAVMNAANEVAVQRFLAHEISFNDIPVLISRVMDKHQVLDDMVLDNILQADSWARRQAVIMDY